MMIELKPMSLSELLDRTFTIYRNNFWLFCGLMAVPELAVATSQMISFLLFPVHIVPVTPANAQNPFAALTAMKSSLGAGFVVLLFSAICMAFAFGAVTLAVSEICLGRRATVRESFRMVRKRVPGLLGLILLLMLIAILFVFTGALVGTLLGALLGSGLTLVGGAGAARVMISVVVVVLILASIFGGALLALWMLMRFAVSIPVFLLEQLGVTESMGRSGALTRGHRWRILGAVIVMYVIVYAVQAMFSAPFVVLTMIDAVKGVLPTWLQMGSAVAAAVGGTLAGPLMMITLALIYYDVRIRKEAFDLEAMMARLEPAAAVPQIPSASGPTMSGE
jgi:hypothetical protein